MLALIHLDLTTGPVGAWVQAGDGTRTCVYLPNAGDLAGRGRELIGNRRHVDWAELVRRMSNLSPYLDSWASLNVDAPATTTAQQVLDRARAAWRPPRR